MGCFLISFCLGNTPRQLVNTTIAVDTTDENKLFHSQVINGASVNTFLYPDTIHSDGKNVVGILIISALLLKDSIKHQKNGNATTIKATAKIIIFPIRTSFFTFDTS